MTVILGKLAPPLVEGKVLIGKRFWDEKEITKLAKAHLENGIFAEPDWQNDPTYFAPKRTKRVRR